MLTVQKAFRMDQMSCRFSQKGQSRAGLGRAGQGRAGQGRAGHHLGSHQAGLLGEVESLCRLCCVAWIWVDVSNQRQLTFAAHRALQPQQPWSVLKQSGRLLADDHNQCFMHHAPRSST